MSANNLERKLQDAIQAVLQRAFGNEFEVHTGQASDTLALPYCSVIARDGQPAIQDTASTKFEVDIAIKSDPDVDADDTEHSERQGTVYDTVLTDPKSTFVSAVNTSGVEEFTLNAYREIGRRQGLEGRAYASTLTIECICSGSILS